MKLALLLLRASWRPAAWGVLLGLISGVSSIALVALILRFINDSQASAVAVGGQFATLCIVMLISQVGSQMLIARLTQDSIQTLQIGLCQRILNSPIRHLEQIGSSRMLASLTGDVSVISNAMRGAPLLAVNIVMLLVGAVYLGSQSLPLLLAAAAFCVVSVASYWGIAAWAHGYVKRAREQQNLLQERIQELISGVKELKMHSARRQDYVERALAPAGLLARTSQYLAEVLQSSAIGWGRLLIVAALGLLVFVWPQFHRVDAVTLGGYVLTVLYLISPLESIVAWVPYMSLAAASVRQIEQLGLMLDEQASEPTGQSPLSAWNQIELQGLQFTQASNGHSSGFVLGPLDLSIHRGEILFIIGGNGSGKTTFGKLLTGLYEPNRGDLTVDGLPITGANRDAYRQLFSVAFDDAAVFDSLWGLGASDQDELARDYLRQFELDHVVQIAHGKFSTTKLSRGQRKRLALVTACLEDRSIYVFDEWAADQDPVFRSYFYRQLLPELKRRGKTVVAITHDDRYFDAADRMVKLDEGHIVEISAASSAQVEQLTGI